MEEYFLLDWYVERYMHAATIDSLNHLCKANWHYSWTTGQTLNTLKIYSTCLYLNKLMRNFRILTIFVRTLWHYRNGAGRWRPADTPTAKGRGRRRMAWLALVEKGLSVAHHFGIMSRTEGAPLNPHHKNMNSVVHRPMRHKKWHFCGAPGRHAPHKVFCDARKGFAPHNCFLNFKKMVAKSRSGAAGISPDFFWN
jgi:hypothetical protein